MSLCIIINLVILFTLANGFLIQNGTGSGSIFQSNGCPDGWTRYDLHCYNYSSSRKTWTTAENTCEQFGGHLVVIEDNDEDSFIGRFIERSLKLSNYAVYDRTFNYTWIGASDIAKEGNWLWVTGKPVGVYTNWRGPGPNNGNNGSHTENCMDWSFGGWNDSHCAGHLNFVCEIESNGIP
ncbi:perlucin-like protein [Mytilus trossulus]|uniref:perlucin-like protein n=1 Tax=Mytilus trossulus TaxID=6551 RepID=UPI00300554D2